MSNVKFRAHLVEKRLVIWNSKEGSELFKLGYYGKPLGIPKPKSPEFDVPLLLDLMEGVYLAEKGKLHVYEGEVRLPRRALIKRAKQTYKDFHLKYRVYRDLRDYGLIVQPGIKFGCDFAVYERGPGIDHAPFLVQVKKATESMDAIEIVQAGRLATTVRKRFIIAVPVGKTEDINYMMFKWWKA